MRTQFCASRVATRNNEMFEAMYAVKQYLLCQFTSYSHRYNKKLTAKYINTQFYCLECTQFLAKCRAAGSAVCQSRFKSGNQEVSCKILSKHSHFALQLWILPHRSLECERREKKRMRRRERNNSFVPFENELEHRDSTYFVDEKRSGIVTRL